MVLVHNDNNKKEFTTIQKVRIGIDKKLEHMPSSEHIGLK